MHKGLRDVDAKLAKKSDMGLEGVGGVKLDIKPQDVLEDHIPFITIL